MPPPLYDIAMLRLAAGVADFGRLDAPHASAERRSPVCGSRVVVDVVLDDAARITAVGIDASACALGQASATLFARAAAGRTAEDIDRARRALSAWLAGECDLPADWPGIEALAVARGYPARHASIRLPFEAGAAAAREAAR